MTMELEQSKESEETALSVPSMQRQIQDAQRGNNKDNKGDDDGVDDYEYDDPNDPYLQKITVKSIRTSDGSEVVIQVQWLEDETTKLELSTRLEEGAMAPLFSGAEWSGTRIWHAAITMVHILSLQYSSKRPTSNTFGT